MTWAKLDDRFTSDPRLLRLSRDVRLLWVEGLTYCAGHLTDGFVADYMLRKITDSPDPDGAAQCLVDAGLWELHDDGEDKGWTIAGYLEHQSSRADVEVARQKSAETTARNRRHKAGDHSTCIQGRFCPQGAVTRHVTEHVNGQSSRQSSPLEPTLSYPTPREGKEKGSEAAPPAPLRSQERTSSSKRSGFVVTMPSPSQAEESGTFIYSPPACRHHGEKCCLCPNALKTRESYHRRLTDSGVDSATVSTAFQKWQTESSAYR